VLSSNNPISGRGVIQIYGRDTTKLLQGLVSNDVTTLEKKKMVATVFLTPKGESAMP